ncbi:MAG: hypothetical protein P8K77_01585 [Polaribacter sp.]|nr:hypothetical protein [Polaribacter sp.]
MMRVTLKSVLTLSGTELEWINHKDNIAAVAAIYAYLKASEVDEVYVPEAVRFSNLAKDALMNGNFVDFKELYISYPTPDDNYVYQGTKQLIPNPLVLSNGDKVDITFGTTTDMVNADQQVATDLVDGMKFALEQANSNLSASEQITSIYIMATTNGHVGPKYKDSNHRKATALDISRINGEKMILSGLTNQIKELQKAFDNFQYIRENFGPYFKHKYDLYTQKWDYNKAGVGAHKDHIHIAVRK